jgi:hypothetical protein
MIWKLPHPVRGIVVFLAVWLGGTALGGFGMGVFEVAVLTLLALGALSLANRPWGGTKPLATALASWPGISSTDVAATTATAEIATARLPS